MPVLQAPVHYNKILYCYFYNKCQSLEEKYLLIADSCLLDYAFLRQPEQFRKEYQHPGSQLEQPVHTPHSVYH